MRNFRVTTTEVYTVDHNVEAETIEDAIQAVYDGNGEVDDNSFNYVEMLVGGETYTAPPPFVSEE